MMLYIEGIFILLSVCIFIFPAIKCKINIEYSMLFKYNSWIIYPSYLLFHTAKLMQITFNIRVFI